MCQVSSIDFLEEENNIAMVVEGINMIHRNRQAVMGGENMIWGGGHFRGHNSMFYLNYSDKAEKSGLHVVGRNYKVVKQSAQVCSLE